MLISNRRQWMSEQEKKMVKRSHKYNNINNITMHTRIKYGRENNSITRERFVRIHYNVTRRRVNARA